MLKRIAVLFVLFCVGNSLFAQPVLTLEDAIKLALEKNFDILIARNDEDIAATQNNWGMAGALPTVGASGSYTISNSSVYQKLNSGTEIDRKGATLQNQNASVSAQWRIFNGFRAVAAKKRLEELENIGGLAVRQQANLAVYNVISAYLNLLRLKLEKQALQETLELFKERMDLAQNRFNIGTSAKSDFLQAQVDFAEQQNNLLVVELNTKESISFLNNLLSRNPDELFAVTDTITTITLPARSEIISSIDTLNPQLLIAKSNELVLMQQAREINAQRLPTLTLNAGASYNNSKNSAGQFLRNSNYGPTAGLTLGIPIYQGGNVKTQLRVNEIQQKTQRIVFDQIKNDLQTSLANAYNSQENADRKYQLEKANLEVVKENNFIAMERFRKGSITTVELRQTQINFIESQTRLINALYQKKQAQADVLLIMGKLVE